MNRALLFGILLISLAGAGLAQNRPERQQSRDGEARYNDNQTYTNTIPAGTEIPVRADETINLQDGRNDHGRVYRGSIASDVTGSDGSLLIPRGSQAELMVTTMGSGNGSNSDLTVDLESITANGHRYMVSAATYDHGRSAGLGKNKRTGEYVGGGALFGTIVGAIAGGGKGAAIGALAGGAAGGGAQVLTRGRTINIPAETVLRFKLNEPLELAQGPYSQDRGNDRNGVHYHDNYYGDDQQNNGPKNSPEYRQRDHAPDNNQRNSPPPQ